MEHTAPRRSHNSVLGTFEELTADPRSTPYNYAPTERSAYPSDDPFPLFLSDPEGEPDPMEFSIPSERGSKLTSRIAAVLLATSAVGILAAVFYSDAGRDLIANAKASISNVIAEQTAAPSPVEQVVHKIPSKDPARVTNPIVLVRTDPADTSASAPSRDAIATAYQNALQSRAPAAAPVPAPAPAAAAPAPIAAPPAPAIASLPVSEPTQAVAPPPAPAPAKTIDPETLAGLINRAKGMLAVGDIPPARLLLERAATAQDATAAFLLAQTYDPAVLGTRDIRTITPDPAIARDWYQKAARLGSADAQARLAQLQN